MRTPAASSGDPTAAGGAAVTCASCLADCPDGARFCAACGTRLGGEGLPEYRKTVTVLFCDVTGSTALSEQLDPEALRQVMVGYYRAMRACLLRHGGTVEKFIGDAVMAVFGVPLVREDDALRALRAAVDMGRSVATLSQDLQPALGRVIAVHIGVNTGEVVSTGDPAAGQLLVAGEAVNVAARLEEAAAPGEVLLGAGTWKLTRDAVVAEPVAPLTLKGRSGRVDAWRLVAIRPDAPVLLRRPDTPLVGREPELRQLRLALERATHARSCTLVTLYGDAGAGKSRLAAAFLESARAAGARTAAARCPAYGESGVFAPLRELFTQLVPGDLHAGVSAALGSTAASRRVTALLRRALASGSVGSETDETFWAVRALLEALASGQPLVAVLDDLHRASPALLDLVEHLAEWARGAIVLLCPARPELLDRRPVWGGGRRSAVSLAVPPLSRHDTLVLLSGLALDPDALAVGAHAEGLGAAERIAEVAEGNPLFAEHLAAAFQEGAPVDTLPPGVHAVLAARVDRLEAAPRTLLEHAAVLGREFTLDALRGLAAPALGDGVTPALRELLRRRLVEPRDQAPAPQDTYRFAGAQVREVAYERLPKRRRAELHERVAVRLEERGEATAETIAYHLERAYRHLTELGPAGGHAISVARRAAGHLATAGAAALTGADPRGAAGLLDRALALHPTEDATRRQIMVQLGEALLATGEATRAKDLLEETRTAARAASDRGAEAYALLGLAFLRSAREGTEVLLTTGKQSIPLFESAGDDLGLAKAWLRLGQASQAASRYGAAAGMFQRALEHATRAGAGLERANALGGLALSQYLGPEPALRAIGHCERLLRAADGDLQVASVAVSCPLAVLLAMRRRAGEARDLLTRVHALVDALGHTAVLATLPVFTGVVESLAGRPAAAEQALRRGCDALRRAGDGRTFASAADKLAHVLLDQGRTADALELTELSRTALPGVAPSRRIGWQAAHARVLAARGDMAAAERLAAAAVALSERTDSPDEQAGALLSHARVLAAAGRGEAAATAARAAAGRYRAKGNLVGQDRAAALLAEVTGG